jgi:hypothetical protein
VKYREPSYLPGTPDSAASGSLGAAIIPFRETRRSSLLAVFALAVMTFGITIPFCGHETSAFNCPSNASFGGACTKTYGTPWVASCIGDRR